MAGVVGHAQEELKFERGSATIPLEVTEVELALDPRHYQQNVTRKRAVSSEDRYSLFDLHYIITRNIVH